MHLKALRIQGFKTFARRVELPFSHGITAIVGPNGSGKSNLVDAVRWALGERNARQIRGQRMEDLIYSGGPGKAQVGMAEVTLIIDNADGRLPVEFNEIEVTRRLYRSGESHYFINSSAARLKDIDALLASTGLRQDGYAVVAQNDIDFVIQAVPATRRALIEEAAGVRRLRDQREEASRRLDEARKDMQRAHDVLGELQPRVEELRVQAAAAQEYRALETQLRTLQGSLARDAWRKAKLQLKKAESRMAAARAKRAAADAALADFAPTYAARRSALAEARDARFMHQQRLAELKLKLAAEEHRERIAEERAEAAARALATAQHGLQRLVESTRAGRQVVAELDRAMTAAGADQAAAAAALQEARACERTRAHAQADLDGQRSTLVQRRQDAQRERLRADYDLRQLSGRMQFLQEQCQQAMTERGALLAQQAAAASGTQREEARLREATAALDQATATLEQVEAHLEQRATQLTTAEASAVNATRELQTHQAELGALRVLRDRAQPQSPLSNGSLGLRRLFELIEVDEPHRRAVEAALEESLQGWVTRTEELAERAMGLVSESAPARETILLEPGEATQAVLPDGLTSVRGLVRAPAALSPLLDALLGQVALVADLAEARRVRARHSAVTLVTATGELLTPVLYRGGGSADLLLELQARATAAEAAVQAGTAGLAEAQRKVDRCRQEQATARTERTAAAATLDLARATVGELKAAAAAASTDAARQAQQGLHLEHQVERYARLLAEAQSQEVAFRAAAEKAAETEAAVDAQLSRLDGRARDLTQELAVALGDRQTAEVQAALAAQRHEDLARQRAAAAESLRGHSDELAQREAAVLAQESQPASLLGEAARWRTAAQETRERVSALEQEPVPDTAVVESLEAEVRADEERNVAFQVEAAHAEDAESAARVEVETGQAEVYRCAAALREDQGSVEEGEPLTEVDWQKTEREVVRLQRRLDAIGAVNLLAPEEFDQSRDRCESLLSQLQDLETAATQLVELRRRLEQDIDTRFRTVFQSVAVNFQEFFQELFEGGRATLRLQMPEDSSSPLDEGVEILAQTPGKRLQPLSLLSGGERALTALAFLFALQAVNPSPFHVLDEVDAALDDANVVRFNRVLTRLAAGQQFLIVTHNHSTMAKAEVLYGVTLGEHGISRVVSVRLDREGRVPALRERTA